jgi:hypothetical protein
MTKLNSDTAPKTGAGTDTDRSSDSPLSIRRGDADSTDIDPSPVQTSAGQFNYDKNAVESLGPVDSADR